jgi:hypothetical protein
MRTAGIAFEESSLSLVVLVNTASGSAYVLSQTDAGVHWRRVPGARPGRIGDRCGWEPEMPAVVPGERLLLRDLRSTKITRVSILPT